MKKLLLLGFGMLMALTSLVARADVLVLVHGYLGSAHSWEESGVSAVLDSRGWKRAGMVVPAPGGAQLIAAPVTGSQGDNRVYSVELPSMAPLMVQADQLQMMLKAVAERHPAERLILAGHSAGGVVARLALVRGSRADALITIASPNLGTARAIEALDATDGSGPIGMIKDFFGGELYHTVKHSWGVLVDLTPAHPGSLLYWLNAQRHPAIEYYSVVRTGPVGLGDELVPIFSQDLNNVPALKGKAEVLPLAAGHQLNPQDGAALLSIINGLKST
jgi:triacylglycerol lipase